MRASRLVSVLLLLQARGRLTAHELASSLEVSERTIYRDIVSLQAAGVPVYGDAGPAGGYRLLDGYQTRLTGLTPDEAQALFLAGAPAAVAELGLGTVLASAELKLRAALPAGLRDRVAVLRDRFHLDAPGWYAETDSSPHLAGVADAVWNQRRIQVRYRRWVAPTDVTRTLDPHGIVLKAGRWYLVARSDGRFRTYRVNQILGLTLLGERFDRDTEFELAGYWDSYLTEFRARLYQGEATVRLSRHGRERLYTQTSPVVIRAIEASAGPPDEHGWVTAVVPTESLQHAQGEFLRLGTEVEVLAPAALRELMRDTAHSLARLYQLNVSAGADEGTRT
jgi:predicted DNA-binding transcriptional regulator YafY